MMGRGAAKGAAARIAGTIAVGATGAADSTRRAGGAAGVGERLFRLARAVEGGSEKPGLPRPLRLHAGLAARQ